MRLVVFCIRFLHESDSEKWRSARIIVVWGRPSRRAGWSLFTQILLALIAKLLSLFHLHPSVNTDTRKVQPGDLFFALKGERFDGNRFAAQALAAGASYAILDDPAFHDPEDERYILVENSLKALQDLARAYRQEFNIPIFGLTGSNGKTTTKELIHAVLQTEQKAYATAGNFNNHIGVPLTLLAMPRDTEVAVIEMGANQPGDIAELAAIAEPNYGMITNIGSAHLERFLSLEGVQRTKGELFDFLRANRGTIILNEADEKVVAVAKGIYARTTFGGPTSDFKYRIKENQLEGMQVEITCDTWAEPEVFQTQLSGDYNAMNIVAAVAVGSYFGISLEGAKAGIAAYVPQNNRSQVVKLGNKTLWLDAYNANPSSMKAAIQHICSIQPKGAVLIVGDMFELGENSEALHAELGKFIDAQSPALTIGVGNMMKAALAEIGGATAWFEDAKSAQQAIPTLLKDASLILIKGSRGMALEKLVDVLN